MSYLFKTEGEGDEIDITNAEILTQLRINGCIKYTIEVYKSGNKHDKGLLNDYQGDFAGWTEQIFDIAHKTALKCSRDHLKRNGIFMHSGSGYKISRGLVKILDYDRLHEWPEDEILKMMNTDP
ncbi:hypothetical protein GcC1_060039 [Golovinomyces cichoracearum]|uniref:Integrase and RNaseH domain-containing protein n=1 Tax=Golovinomyces cichoracearum TaxID=62708 RepID=A0A420ITJ3_9PEZI|nr:hypothetical protein GcC1_060039 [Golovinomyces cichoracearum]